MLGGRRTHPPGLSRGEWRRVSAARTDGASHACHLIKGDPQQRRVTRGAMTEQAALPSLSPSTPGWFSLGPAGPDPEPQSPLDPFPWPEAYPETRAYSLELFLLTQRPWPHPLTSKVCCGPAPESHREANSVQLNRRNMASLQRWREGVPRGRTGQRGGRLQEGEGMHSAATCPRAASPAPPPAPSHGEPSLTDLS